MLRPARGGGRGAHAVVDLREHRLDRAKQRLARRVERDAAPRSVKEREAELLFQQLDLLSDRAVRQVQFSGRGAPVREPRNGTEGGRVWSGRRIAFGIVLVGIAEQNVQRRSIPSP